MFCQVITYCSCSNNQRAVAVVATMANCSLIVVTMAIFCRKVVVVVIVVVAVAVLAMAIVCRKVETCILLINDDEALQITAKTKKQTKLIGEKN